MFKKILIPLDGSLRAEQALELVKKLSPKNKFELILLEATSNLNFVYSVYGHGPHSYVHVSSDLLKKDDEYIKSVTEKTEKWAPDVESHLKFNMADRAIIETAIQEDVDLIIMVTRGYSGLERFLLSSVTEKVIREAPCPVLAVLDGHIPNHMLIAVDGTKFSETILEPAFALAELIKADITLTRVDIPKKQLRPIDVSEIRRFDPALADSVIYNQSNEADLYLKALHRKYSNEAEEINVMLDYDLARGRPGDHLPLYSCAEWV